MTHSIELDIDTERRLERLAARSGRSPSEQLHELLLNALEDAEDVEVAERELEAVRSGTSKTVPLEEVMKRYGMEP